MDNAEIKQKIESSFGPCPPYYCGVEFQPVNGIEGLGIQVSDEDGTLLTYTGKATLKVVEHDFEELINPIIHRRSLLCYFSSNRY